MSEQPPQRSFLDTLPSPAYIVAIGAVVLVAVVAFFLIDDNKTDAPTPPPTADLELGAKDVCHQEVESQLKAPSTAKYSGETVSHSGDRYVVEGSVDSENSFGANLRSRFTCSATFVAGDRWDPVVATVG